MEAGFNAYAMTVKHHSLLLERLQKRIDELEEANTELVEENSRKDVRFDDLEKRMNAMQETIGAAAADDESKARAAREQLTVEEMVNLDQSLISAAQEGGTHNLKVLISRGANVNAVPTRYVNRFQTIHFMDHPRALSTAAGEGHVDTVQVLIEHGAVVNAKSSNKTALDYALKEGHSKVAEILQAAGAKISSELPDMFFTAN